MMSIENANKHYAFDERTGRAIGADIALFGCVCVCVCVNGKRASHSNFSPNRNFNVISFRAANSKQKQIKIADNNQGKMGKSV